MSRPTTVPDPNLPGDIPTGDVSDEFVAAVRRCPDRPALVHNEIEITYRGLASRVRTAAAHCQVGELAAAKNASGRIGVVVSHDPAAVEHLLGMLQAGVTYCPVDSASGAARRQSVATALGLPRLVTARAQSQHRTLGALPVPRWRGADAAYVLCTSGSTGAPKPVVVSRGALTTTVRALRDVFGLTPQDRVLQFASLAWDTCLEEILPALTAGAAVIFDERAHAGSFPAFLRMLDEQQITVLDLPTAFWHELVLFLTEEGEAIPSRVRLVIIGGERVDPTRLRQWRRLDSGHIELLNTYGCTETTMITHAVRLSGPGTEPHLEHAAAEAPLGRPLPHVRQHITDDGELLISGPALATGYLGAPDLTCTAFPIADHGGGSRRWFRTGDLVDRDEHGLLYPRGRTDEQVKIRGVRVHPAEVEMQLNSHPAVAGAVVLGEPKPGGTVLTAYVVAFRGVTGRELKRYLGERLPSQFVPTRVHFVDALPYTSSGKVDRTAVRRPVAAHDEGVSR